MNVDNLTQMLQTGFRVTLGATSSLVEILQDNQKRTENLDQLQSKLQELTEEWAAKGEVTESEARKFVESMLNQSSGIVSTPTETASSTTIPITTTQTTPSNPDAAAEIQALTAAIAELRTELEKSQDSDSKK